jgi:hypothetical protein
MFDSREDQINAEGMDGSAKEKLMRFFVLSAVTVVVGVAVFAAVVLQDECQTGRRRIQIKTT